MRIENGSVVVLGVPGGVGPVDVAVQATRAVCDVLSRSGRPLDPARWSNVFEQFYRSLDECLFSDNHCGVPEDCPFRSSAHPEGQAFLLVVPGPMKTFVKDIAAKILLAAGGNPLSPENRPHLAALVKKLRHFFAKQLGFRVRCGRCDYLVQRVGQPDIQSAVDPLWAWRNDLQPI